MPPGLAATGDRSARRTRRSLGPFPGAIATMVLPKLPQPYYPQPNGALRPFQPSQHEAAAPFQSGEPPSIGSLAISNGNIPMPARRLTLAAGDAHVPADARAVVPSVD